MNLYKVLGVSEQAEAGQNKQAYRKLAKKYHPDLNPGNQKAERRFKEVAYSYEILGNPEKRKKYDESLQAAAGTGKRKQAASANPFEQGMAGGQSVWDDFMSRMAKTDPFHMSAGAKKTGTAGASQSNQSKQASDVKGKNTANPIDVTKIFETYMKIK